MMVACVGGTRPNFVKIAALLKAFRQARIRTALVHTGQHYDDSMSGCFFRELRIRRPDASLRVGSASHAVMMARVMTRLEPVLRRIRPDGVVVVGDVDSTLAAALAAVKMGIRVAHIEAGLRSFDDSMPEEINRRLTDSVSDLLFTTCREADRNLRREAIPPSRIHFVGNVMIDTLREHESEARDRAAWKRFACRPGSYAVVTLHRPSNVDRPERLAKIVRFLRQVQARLPALFPVHPRTLRAIRRGGLRGEFPPARPRAGDGKAPRLLPPLGYLDFLSLLTAARVVVTDSGGIQEECAVLGVPCLTLRANTERPITQWAGANRIVSDKPEEVLRELDRVLRSARPRVRLPLLWDGRAAGRIAAVLKRVWGKR